MVEFFELKKPGPTDLTWEEKNSGNYVYPRNHGNKQRDACKEQDKEKKSKQRE